MEKVIKFDERKKFYKNAKYWQELLIKYTDVDHRFITNDRAKYVFGSICRIPNHLQTSTLNDMECIGLIRRFSKRLIEIVPIV